MRKQKEKNSADKETEADVLIMQQQQRGYNFRARSFRLCRLSSVAAKREREKLDLCIELVHWSFLMLLNIR